VTSAVREMLNGERGGMMVGFRWWVKWTMTQAAFPVRGRSWPTPPSGQDRNRVGGHRPTARVTLPDPNADSLRLVLRIHEVGSF